MTVMFHKKMSCYRNHDIYIFIIYIYRKQVHDVSAHAKTCCGIGKLIKTGTLANSLIVLF